METSPSSVLGVPRPSGGRSRFSKALPAPPSLDETDHLPSSFPARIDSLPSRPALPPKDSSVRKALPIPSDMATKMMDTPLPPLPSLVRVNSPPTVVPKRKPVGSGVSVRSHPSPPPSQPLGGGEISPVESISSLLSAYGTEDSSEAPRNSVETAATKYSSFEPSPPKVLPKDHLGGAAITKLDLVSPLALPTPVSSNMGAEQYQQQPRTWQQVGQAADHPPTPPMKDAQRPTTPKSARTVAQRPVDLAGNSPLSSPAKQSPSQPQLLRRRSLKSDKPMTLPELKLTSSHGSTSSSQQVISSLNNELPALPKPRPPFADKAGVDSPTRNGFGSLPGRNIRPSASQKALPRSPQPPADMGNRPSKEPLDGFSQYAQEIEDSNLNRANKTPQYSPAKMSPEEIRRPPTPEYFKDDNAQSGRHDVVSRVSPMTPPEDSRPLSVIGEDVGQALSPRAAAAVASPAASRPHLLQKASPRPGGSPSGSKIGLPRSPRGNGNSPSLGAKSLGGASLLTPSPIIQPGPSSPHARSISDTSVPTIEISDDGASTIKAPNSPPRPATSASSSQNAMVGWQQHHHHPAAAAEPQEAEDENENANAVAAAPGEPNYFPMAHYNKQRRQPPVAPGTVLAAAPLRPNQLDCFANHYRFVPSRNEDHPLACQSCDVRDRGVRFTCAHCGVRICLDCRDVLVMNGRDLNKLVKMLKT